MNQIGWKNGKCVRGLRQLGNRSDVWIQGGFSGKPSGSLTWEVEGKVSALNNAIEQQPWI
jgi:hypothetical protein